MKFDDLYNRVFVNEQDEMPADTTSEIADPNDPAYDVEGAPLPEITQDETLPDNELQPQAASGLNDYIKLTLDFVKQLQDPDGGESLQTLVKRLDFPGSGFEGISSSMSSKILAAVKSIQDVTAEIVSRNIHAAKK